MSVAGARTRVQLTLDGLVAIHAVRAVRTALSVVPSVVFAEVTMAGVVLDIEGTVDAVVLRATLDDALDAAGVRIVTFSIVPGRVLPLA